MYKIVTIIVLVAAVFGCNSGSTEGTSTSTSNSIGATVKESNNEGAKYISDIFGINAESKTPGGLFYHLVKSNNGPKTAVGSFGELSFSQFKRDSFLGGSTTMGKPLVFQLPPADKEGKLSVIIEALKVMGVGDSIQLFFPVDSFDTKRLPPYYLGEKYMRIDFGMNKIMTQEEYTKSQEAEKQKQMALAKKFQAMKDEKLKFVQKMASDYKAGKLNSKLKTTESGLKYIIHENGSGNTAGFGANVSVNYFGILPDGTPFDNSYGRGQPIVFPLGQGRVIKGWDEGISYLKKGGSATLFIPAKLGYGAAGSPPKIPANSELIFYVSLEDFTGGAK